jgi:hypothetical protein
MVPAVWLLGSQVLDLMTPGGRTYEGSLSHRFASAETGRVPEYLDYLRTENGLECLQGSQNREGSAIFLSNTGMIKTKVEQSDSPT